MKSKLFIFSLLLFSQKLMGQFSIVQPEAFTLPLSSNTPCPVSDMGKIYYNINSDRILYCRSENASTVASSLWEGTTAIYYMGKIGINRGIPSEEVDLLGNVRFNTLFVDGRIGINTITPTEKLEIVNRNLSIKSTADENYWSLNFLGLAGKLDFREAGLTRLQINNGGNLEIGNPGNTNKLNVEGNGSYAGSLTIEGKGILANTNVNQLVMYTMVSSSTGDTFTINNNTCKTSGFSYGINTFTQAPTVVQGQKIAGNNIDAKLVISIENVTTTGGTMRFCNNSGGAITLDNAVYSLILIGQ